MTPRKGELVAECWCKGQCPNTREAGELLSAGKPRLAEAALARRLVDAPRCAAGNLFMAKLLIDDNRAEASMTHVRQAVDAGGWTAAAMRIEGARLRSLMLVRQAVQIFERVASHPNSNVQDWQSYVEAVERSGDYARAASVIADAMRKFPDALSFRRPLASIKAAQKDFAGAIAVLTVDNARPLELLDRGRFRDRLGDHAGAWHDWMTAKDLLRSPPNNHAFRRADFDTLVSQLHEVSTPARLKLLPQSLAAPPVTPLFVTGFPRSGTTLTETALGAHPEIFAADELNYLHQAKELLPRILNVGLEYPLCLGAAGLGEHAGAVELVAGYYARKAMHKAAAQGAHLAKLRFFTDKMPLNEMDLPFIAMLFPGAVVRHVRRHPLDVMVSNMSHFIIHGWFNASTLESCAYAYAAVDNLVEHYRRVMAPGDFRVVPYDAIAGGAEQLSSYLPAKLERTPAAAQAVENFHGTGRHSRTISYEDIRQPLFDRSLGRWRHYRAQLAPAVEILRPILERDGFEY